MKDRHAEGRFYTPSPVVRYIVRHTLDSLLAEGSAAGDLRILEPACGAGVFLQEACRWLRETTPQLRGRSLLAGLFGLDRDPQAVAAARRLLADEAASDGPAERSEWDALLARNLRHGDALIGSDFFARGPGGRLPAGGGSPCSETAAPVPCDWPREFPQIFAGRSGGFDAVIGNPPYVNIRRLTTHHGPRIKEYLRRRFRCARGGYDLYVLFCELAWQLLRPGGVCGMIVPNKIASLDYASECRALLQEHTCLLEITDLSRCKVFPDASVYPYVLIWRKTPPAPQHRVAVISVASLASLPAAPVARRVIQSQLQRAGWHLHGSLEVEGRVPISPLREVAQVHSGTTGFDAARVAGLLREWQADEPATSLEFVVTGNVDRYLVRPGGVRFMNRHFVRPVMTADIAAVTAGKRDLYRGPKILVAGMSRRLEAAWDPGGLALGVQLYAVVPQIDPFYLLALLNAKLLSHLFRLRYQAKRLSGDYLSVNKSQLAALPIRRVDPECRQDRSRAAELADLARQMTALGPAASAADPEGRLPRETLCSLDRQIDGLVYALYRLTDAEIELAEATYPP